MSEPAPELSIIIPAFNEEKRLGRALERIESYFSSKPSGIGSADLEVIVVDDGSTDGTVGVAEEWVGRMPGLRVLSGRANRGKGYSVRQGMLEARGRIGLFTDADLSAPIEEWEKLLAAIRAGKDGAIGSRAMDRSLIATRQSRLREIAGMIFNGFVRGFTGLPFQDTQCGFKAFVLGRCRVIFEQQRIEGFGFDPEILFLARRYRLEVEEVPVRWSHDPATKVHVIGDSIRMFGDLLVIRWNWLCDRYAR
jgi:glycosyltransferase involved in cell wall biosynthesis